MSAPGNAAPPPAPVPTDPALIPATGNPSANPNVKLPAAGTASSCEMWSTQQGSKTVYILGCIMVSNNAWACNADELSKPIPTPNCAIPNYSSNCSTQAFHIPPPAPGQPAFTLLGCSGASSNDMELKCHTVGNLRGNPSDAANNAGTSTQCLTASLKPNSKNVGGTSANGGDSGEESGSPRWTVTKLAAVVLTLAWLVN